MRFAQLSSLFLFVLSFGLVLSSPITKAVFKLDNTTLATIFDTLNSTVDPILFQISSAISSGTANNTSIAPLIHELDNALNNASFAIRDLEDPNETAEDIVGLAAPIINEIVKVVEPLRTLVSISTLRRLDVAVAHMLYSLAGHVDGLLNLVAARLADVVTLLHQLTFGLILSALGL